MKTRTHILRDSFARSGFRMLLLALLLVVVLVVLLASTAQAQTVDLGSHTYPTYLFIASYDWLHNFYDRNARGARGNNHQSDPDTDNFNKIIVLDSNLFPIITAVVGDHEFPNITSRNTLTWWAGSPSRYSPSVNDYFNRGIAVAPDFISKHSVLYSDLSTIWENPSTVTGNAPIYREMYQYGARSMMQWAFVTDPGNHNIRRYEFKKLEEFFDILDAGNVSGPLSPSPPGAHGNTNCQANPDDCVEDRWMWGTIDQIVCSDFPNLCSKYQSDDVLWFGKHNSMFSNIDNIGELQDPSESNSINDNSVDPNTFPYLEFIITIPENVPLPYNDLKLHLYGNERDSATSLVVGINSRRGDPPTTGLDVPMARLKDKNFTVTSNNANAYDHEVYDFSSLSITSAWDVDSTKEGVQIRIRIYSVKGGFIIDQIIIGDQDSAFTVKYAGPQSLREVRWNVIASFLETVPPESYGGYPSYTSSANGTLGYGYRTNTSFTTAKYVRFSDPRDIAVYRDMFDPQNNGPTYIFVADTGNSRIQVFMNATGSAGETNAEFPIRPVPVKGPNVADFNTNELAMRFPNGRYGHGYKADWRHYTTVSGDTLANSRIPANAGRGEFYYPHGVAVDQDPDTRDIYLFVADTFNHRIQIFRDTTGVTNHPITNKRFDFKYEEGWGTYPLQTTMTMTPPGPFCFRFPKGIDVARFSNNSSYLYVVDAKDYRVMKYLISEGSASEGIQSVDAVAGYGYNGTNFVGNLTTIQGVPMTASNTTPGFLNPHDVATGYSGFYLYSTPNTGGYRHEASLNGQTLGVHYLDNHMFYVTDYARNNTSITPDTLNMRVMQFVDYPQRNITGVFLPWKTEAVEFGSWTSNNLTLGQSSLGIFYGVYSSAGRISAAADIVEGSTENVPGVDGFFTDRPVGIATLTWDTVNPFDIRVFDLGNRVIYPNGTTIDNDTLLRIGVHARAFFGIPYKNVSTYTNFTSTNYAWDGKQTQRVHIFCYDTNGAFQNHTALLEPPFEFTPGNPIANPICPPGYMKIVAEENLFGYSGKSGTQIFRVIE
jgi:hypothetical protein